MLRPNFSSGTRFDGDPSQYPALVDHWRVTFTKKNIAELLVARNLRPIPIAIVPIPEQHDQQDNQLIVDLYSLHLKTTQERARLEKNYQTGIALVMECLGENPMSEIAEINRAPCASWYARFNQVYDALEEKYLAHPDVTMLQISSRMENCPMAINVQEALCLLNLISYTNMDLRFFNALNGMTDQQKRFMIMKKLDPTVFSDLIVNMQEQPGNPAYSFAEVRSELRKIENNQRVLATNNNALAEPDTSANIHSPDVGASTPLVNVSQRKSNGPSGCRNCNGQHFIRDCPEVCRAGKTDVCLKHHVHGV